MARYSIFVDGANMYYAQKRLGWFIDYRKVLNCFRDKFGATISEAYYFTGIDPNSRSRDNNFREYLTFSGYTVRTRALKQSIEDVHNDNIEHIELGVDMVVDIFNTLEHFDTAVILSGAGCFERVVDVLKARGKRVIIVSHPEMTSRELRNVVGMNFIDIRDLEPLVSRTDRAPDEQTDMLGEFDENQFSAFLADNPNTMRDREL